MPVGHLETKQFLRRVRSAVFVDGAARAALWGCGVALFVVLVGRLFGLWPTPSPWWTLAVIPIMGFGAWRVHASGFGPGRAIVEVDHRLRLGGLLLAGVERDNTAWREELSRRLGAADEWLPGYDRRRWGRAVLAVAVTIGLILWLPPPAVRPAPSLDTPVAAALDLLEERAEERRTEGILADEQVEELVAKIEELREQQLAGDPVEWADVDSLEAQLERFEHQRADDAQRARHALAQLEAAARRDDADSAAGALAESMAEALEQARQAGLLDTMDPGLLGELGLSAGQEIDVGQLPDSADQLAALAAAMGDALDAPLADLGAAGLVDPGELADLASAVAAAKADLAAADPGHQHGPG